MALVDISVLIYISCQIQLDVIEAWGRLNAVCILPWGAVGGVNVSRSGPVSARAVDLTNRSLSFYYAAKLS